jgi:hypothetical protein
MTHSSRQTLLRLLPICLVLACQGEPTGIPDAVSTPSDVGPALLVTDNVIATMSVTPDSQMVLVGDQFKLTAKPKNKAGQLLSKVIRWRVGTAAVAKALDSLKATVPFRALKVGTSRITATADGKSRSGKVVVRSTTGARVVLTPATATVTTGASATFTAGGRTAANEPTLVNVTWKATGGTISSTGVLKAGTTVGAFQVIATSRFGKADTSDVTVAAPAPSVVLVPVTADVAQGATLPFAAYGRTAQGDSVELPVTYAATGGTIDESGVYTASSLSGTYRVIASSAAGPADTAAVTVYAASNGGVTLLPGIAATRAGATTQFTATVRDASGAAIPEPVRYQTTCGTIGASGNYTAPAGAGSSCLVTAAAGDHADTTEVHVLPRSGGIPLGTFGLWTSGITTEVSGAAAFSASHASVTPDMLIRHIDAARAQGIHLILAMTGGAHGDYKTNGVFDEGKWQAVMDGFNTPAIQTAVAAGVADGTIIGNSVMDEPQQYDRGGVQRDKSWGPFGTMTKARVDGMCAYGKQIFPTLPEGVFHSPNAFEPLNSYHVCQFLMAQYDMIKGDVTAYRDAAIALTQRDGMGLVLGLNVINGGQQDKDGHWDCAGTGGLGTLSPNCAMTADQIRNFGKVLGPAACALVVWTYKPWYMNKPDNQAALAELAYTLSALPPTRCVKTAK